MATSGFPVPLDDARYVGDRAFAFPVRGDCMEPDIRPGDTVLVDPDATVHSGDTVAARVGDSYLVKEAVVREGRIFLRPKNGEQEIELDGDGELIGKVVYLQRSMLRR